MTSVAVQLARRARELEPSSDDLTLAQRALEDTVAVMLAAKDDPIRAKIDGLPEALRWAVLAHVLDFDDLHLLSTSHVSAVCVPAVLAVGGDAKSYLVAADMMARIGIALGWPHYSAGWHATCTAGAPAVAAGIAFQLGLDESGIARAMSLALPGAGGVQRAFGTMAKSLQVGFAVDAGIRAGLLAANGATADPAAFDQWLVLMGGSSDRLPDSNACIPGGLGLKLFPCCYALQRPIAASRAVFDGRQTASEIESVVVRTPESTLQPLIHHRPTTGLQAKFSLEYAIAATALDDYPGRESFTDEAVARVDAKELVERIEIVVQPGGEWLLAGECEIIVSFSDGTRKVATLKDPPGAPERPATREELRIKLGDCTGDQIVEVEECDWSSARALVRRELG